MPKRESMKTSLRTIPNSSTTSNPIRKGTAITLGDSHTSVVSECKLQNHEVPKTGGAT
jgi:hypothetical protein